MLRAVSAASRNGVPPTRDFWLIVASGTKFVMGVARVCRPEQLNWILLVHLNERRKTSYVYDLESGEASECLEQAMAIMARHPHPSDEALESYGIKKVRVSENEFEDETEVEAESADGEKD